MASIPINHITLRLDAHLVEHDISALRKTFFVELLEESSYSFLCVEETKASGQVHWQALVYAPRECQWYRDALRYGLELKKTMYSVKNATNPQGFERYLCKGPTGKHKENVIVVASKGSSYSPEYLVQCHETWHANGARMNPLRVRQEEKKGFLQKAYEHLLSRQEQGLQVSPAVVRSHVWSMAQAGFKCYMPAMLARIIVLVWCRFNEHASRIQEEKLDLLVHEELNSTYMLGLHARTLPEKDRVQDCQGDCRCSRCSLGEEVPSQDPLDQGTQALIYEDEDEEEVRAFRDTGRGLLHAEIRRIREEAQAVSRGGLEVAERQPFLHCASL